MGTERHVLGLGFGDHHRCSGGLVIIGLFLQRGKLRQGRDAERGCKSALSGRFCSFHQLWRRGICPPTVLWRREVSFPRSPHVSEPFANMGTGASWG